MTQKYQFRDPTKGEVIELLCDDLNHGYMAAWKVRWPDGRLDVVIRTINDRNESPYNIIPVPPEPKMTQEAWGVCTLDGELHIASPNREYAERIRNAWDDSRYSVVRIPPLPMERE